MTASLKLQDIRSLIDLYTALSGFSGGINESISTTRAEIQHTMDWILSKVAERQRQVWEAQEQVRQAERALTHCRNSGGHTPEGYYIAPNCSQEEYMLSAAQSYLYTATQRLEAALAWQRRVEQAVTEFQQELYRLAELAGNHTTRSQAVLRQLADRYAAVHGTSVSAIVTQFASPSPRYQTSVPRSNWVNRGVQNIPVSSLPKPEGISGSQDFIKVPENEMRGGLLKLQEMRTRIESGEGASSDYWANLDRQNGRDYSQGYQRIYDAFYGRDAICINKDGNSYDIVNGRHRIWLAQQMGIDVLPMKVIEKG